MSRECKIGLIIDGGTEIDLESEGFHLIESPDQYYHRFLDPETYQYSDDSVVVVNQNTAKESFDHSITLSYYGNQGTANTAIKSLYDQMFSQPGAVYTAKEVEIKNYFKKTSVIGYIKPFNPDTSSFDRIKDIVTFQLTIRVSNPKECNFNL